MKQRRKKKKKKEEEEMKSIPARIISNSRNEEHESLLLAATSSKRDGSVQLLKIISFFVFFTTGAVLGVSLTIHFSPYFASQTELFFPQKLYTTTTSNCVGGFYGDHPKLDRFVSPRDVMHDMSDDELLWRASLVPRKDAFPFKRVVKIAFMFMTRGPLPLIKLWEKLFNGHQGLYSIYVHTLPGYRLVVNHTSPFYSRQIPSKETSWGSITLVDAEKRLLANALLDFNNERFVLISESCIPIYNFPTIYDYLTNSVHSFVEAYDEDSPRGLARYSPHMWLQIKLSKWRKGSEWFEMSRELAVNIVADYKYYLIFNKYCKPSCYPDEHYIATYLNMFYGSLNSNRTITWVDWSKGGPHPVSYDHNYVTEKFIQSIRTNNGKHCLYNFRSTSVCYLFARKFAPNALDPLLRLASTVMEF